MGKIAKHSKKSIFIVAGLLTLLVTGVTTLRFGAIAVAQSAGTCAAGQRGTPQAPCVPSGNLKATNPPPSGNIINDYVNPFIKLLTAVIGVVIVMSVVVAGIQYSAAGGDPSGVAAAKKRITAAVIALIAYAFLLGFLRWLVPGGF
jgi:hypothetical protein